MEGRPEPWRVIADGYDRMGLEFSTWNSARPPEVRRWFLEEALSRLREGSSVLEIGCGPGTDAAELSAGRRYVGVDLSPVQLSIARQRVPNATFLIGDFTTMYVVPPVFVRRGRGVLRLRPRSAGRRRADVRQHLYVAPARRLALTSLQTMEAEDRVEEWLTVPMFFAGLSVPSYERLLRQAGFALELSEFREEVDPIYGPGGHHWVIARHP
jgi:SAM-dependent methyltransferase